MKQGLFILAAVIVIFVGIVLFTDFLGTRFGKTAEIVILCVIAAVLCAALVKSKKK